MAGLRTLSIKMSTKDYFKIESHAVFAKLGKVAWALLGCLFLYNYSD